MRVYKFDYEFLGKVINVDVDVNRQGFIGSVSEISRILGILTG